MITRYRRPQLLHSRLSARRGPINREPNLSRLAPIMQIDKLIRTPVGADLSRPPPIYRPRWIFHYPDEKVKQHNRPQHIDFSWRYGHVTTRSHSTLSRSPHRRTGQRVLCTTGGSTAPPWAFLRRATAQHCSTAPLYDARADAAFRSQFGLLDWEEELVQHTPGFRDPSPTSRVDTFFVTERGGLRLTEYNADTP